MSHNLITNPLDLSETLADADGASVTVEDRAQVQSAMQADLLKRLGEEGIRVLTVVVRSGIPDLVTDDGQACMICGGSGAGTGKRLGWTHEVCEGCAGTGEHWFHPARHPEGGMGFWNALDRLAEAMARVDAALRVAEGHDHPEDQEALARVLTDSYSRALEGLLPRVQRALLRVAGR
jgi:hypothetical protein